MGQKESKQESKVVLNKVIFIYDADFSESFVYTIEPKDRILSDILKKVIAKYDGFNLTFRDCEGNVIDEDNSESILKSQHLFPLHICEVSRTSIEFTIEYKEHKFFLPVQVTKGTKLDCISKLLIEKLGLVENDIAISVKGIDSIIFGWGSKIHNHFQSNRIDEKRQKFQFIQSKYQIIVKDKKYYSLNKIFIRNLEGKTTTIKAVPHDSIETIKQKYRDIEGIPMKYSILLISHAKFLWEGTLSDYNIQEDSQIRIVIIFNNRYFIYNPSEEDLNELLTLKWRKIIKNGLCFEGICQNKNCEAYTQYVIISKGMGVYELNKSELNSICPMCFNPVKVTKYGFYNCQYAYSGYLKDFPDQKIQQQSYKQVPKNYSVQDIKELGQWSSLTIYTKESKSQKNADICIKCQKKIEPISEIRKGLNCQHTFHEGCLYDREECIICED